MDKPKDVRSKLARRVDITKMAKLLKLVGMLLQTKAYLFQRLNLEARIAMFEKQSNLGLTRNYMLRS